MIDESKYILQIVAIVGAFYLALKVRECDSLSG
jgi:hypothetical protein